MQVLLPSCIGTIVDVELVLLELKLCLQKLDVDIPNALDSSLAPSVLRVQEEIPDKQATCYWAGELLTLLLEAARLLLAEAISYYGLQQTKPESLALTKPWLPFNGLSGIAFLFVLLQLFGRQLLLLNLLILKEQRFFEEGIASIIKAQAMNGDNYWYSF